jgi:L-ascorbate metabolism protein UlaG (beta-lactamase superfamily)
MSWRRIADWAKHKPLALRMADRLGRSRGRLAVLDRLHPPPPARHAIDLTGWNNHTLAAAWIGHATVLLRIGGRTILTDPVFSTRIGVGLGLVTAGPRRLQRPAISLANLPPIDLILISHAHFDHLDRPTLARLPRRTPVITAVHTKDLLTDLGFANVRELPWHNAIEVAGLHIRAIPTEHWGARTFHDRHRTYNAYLLQDNARHTVLFGGDTAFTHAFDGLGPIDLAILGIGAYDPYVAAHCTPEQAWAIARAIPTRHLLPMHHSTFRLSHEPTAEPLARLLSAAGKDAGKILVREVGQMWSLAERPE